MREAADSRLGRQWERAGLVPGHMQAELGDCMARGERVCILPRNTQRLPTLRRPTWLQHTLLQLTRSAQEICRVSLRAQADRCLPQLRVCRHMAPPMAGVDAGSGSRMKVVESRQESRKKER